MKMKWMTNNDISRKYVSSPWNCESSKIEIFQNVGFWKVSILLDTQYNLYE